MELFKVLVVVLARRGPKFPRDEAGSPVANHGLWQWRSKVGPLQWSNAAWFTTTLQFGWFNITPMQVRGITDKINLGHLVFDSEATVFFLT